MITSYFSPKNNNKDKKKMTKSSRSTREGNGSKKRSKEESEEDVETTTHVASIFQSSKKKKTKGELSEEVKDMLSHLKEKDEKKKVEDDCFSESGLSWREALEDHVSKSKFDSLAKFLAKERSEGKVVYPPEEDMFSALNLTPPDQVKVVIVGQDPYHGPGQGHGLAFSVRKNIPIPPSLRNIYKEIISDPDITDVFSKIPSHGNLQRWSHQGVLLLNNVLTVRKAEPASHSKKGWEDFTDEVIRIICRQHQTKGVVFLLWGKPASKKAEKLIQGGGKGKAKHEVICTSHPSPLGAAKTSSPFLGSQCFSRANEALRKRGLEEIDWNVDD